MPEYYKLYRTPWLLRLPWIKALWRKKKSKQLYLTFDDGPVPKATEEVLQILRHYGLKATFFCIGHNIEKHPEIFEKVVSEGHVIGNHTYNHLNGWKTKNIAYFENIEKCNRLTNTKLFRPPYGRIKVSQYRCLREQYEIVFWDMVTYDFVKQLNIESTLKGLLKKVRPGAIIVFHDSVKSIHNTRELLPRFIESCHNLGYTFSTL